MRGMLLAGGLALALLAPAGASADPWKDESGHRWRGGQGEHWERERNHRGWEPEHRRAERERRRDAWRAPYRYQAVPYGYLAVRGWAYRGPGW